MDPVIQDFIAHKQIAMVGVSQTSNKFGSMAYKELKSRGYQLTPVHPTAQTIQGDKCAPNLAALPGPVDGVLVCVQPDKVEPVLREAAQAGLKRVWLQQGAESPANLKLGQELGLSLIHGKCILMYAEPVKSIHGFHRFFAKLFGKL